MLSFLDVIKAIKIDKELMPPAEAEKALKMVQAKLIRQDDRGWKSCDTQPYRSLKCLIAYSDGDVISGQYVHNSDFDRGGFFTSMKEFDLDSTGKPVFWMPIPDAPKIPARVA